MFVLPLLRTIYSRRFILSVCGILVSPIALHAEDLTANNEPHQVQVLNDISFAPIVKRVKPSVVSIKVELKQPETRTTWYGQDFDYKSLPPQLREFFENFNNNGLDDLFKRQARPTYAVGSGFIISSNGYVVTNYHVISASKKITIKLENGTSYSGKLIGRDPKTDLALLKIDGQTNLPYVTFAKALPEVGDWVLAIGNPLNLGGTVTMGIVSARGRDIGASPYDDFLQIDASINRGNSGGPTFNLKGEVVGVNTAIATPSGGSVGLGFAIPSTTVQKVVDELIKHGVIDRGFLGVQIQPVSKDIADSLGLSKAEGALVEQATASSPAGRAGIHVGDVINSINGVEVKDARDLAKKVAEYKPETIIKVGFFRKGTNYTVNVTLGKAPISDGVSSLDGSEDQNDNPLGLSLASAESVGYHDKGVVIIGVNPNSPAFEKGLQKGDLITEITGKAVTEPEQISEAIETARKQGRKAILLRVKSANNFSRYLALPLKAS